VDAVSGEPPEDVRWVGVDDPSAVGGARRGAEQLAEQLGFGGSRIAEIGIAVTEMASNTLRHGHGGAVLLRAVREPGGAAVEVVAVDSGPGIADVVAARRDGTSTAGTLGIGLGAIGRLADVLDISSRPDQGTVLVARFDQYRNRGDRAVPALATAGITRALSGEAVCGDAYATLVDGERTWLMVADGSGHGPLAAVASRAAVRVFAERAGTATTPESVMGDIHRALSGTRGAAVAIAVCDLRSDRVRFVGVGNIAGAVVRDGTKHGMASIGGVAGYRSPTIRGFDHPLPAGAAVVLHSDGVRPRWSADVLGHVVGRTPLLVAATLLREAGVRQDDACVLVGIRAR
jgi:anti-sigma regulatory factor (Ser/Thr protein kinase)